MDSILLARVAVSAAGVYALLGLGFAVPFLLRGVEVVDPDARGSGWGFRLILLPGVVALWPLLLRRWRHGQPPEEDSAHRRAARPGGAP